jgi:aryl-alcohol dehydrogenase-like predicted oxidoreductase
MVLARHATTEGTLRYRTRFAERLHASHFRLHNDLWLSSVGLGVYVSEADAAATARCREAVIKGLEEGCNYVDVAFSYRSLHGEQIVGQALGAAFAQGTVLRDEVVVSACGGSVYFEGEYPTDAAAFVKRNLIDARLAAADEFAQGWHHCLSPRYLREQFRRSLTNLGLGALDVYYLRNPEVQRAERGPEVFQQRILAAFAELETQVEAERLAYYGLATEEGFRVRPDDAAYISLERVVELARMAGGDRHRFRYVMAPFNLTMPELLLHRNQVVGGTRMTLLEAAGALGVVVIGSGTLWGGELARHLPQMVHDAFPEAETHAQAAIQFARSAPGLATAVVGMEEPRHVQENLAAARWATVPSEQLLAVF